MQTNNQTLLEYLETYHGGDDGREKDIAKIKILLEDHEEKISNIVKTINELH